MSVNAIYKYFIEPKEEPNVIEMPKGYKILSCGTDPRGRLAIWAMINPEEKEKENASVYCVGTGWMLFDLKDYDYIGNIDDNPYIWHILKEK